MKILIINGSARGKGFCNTIAKELLKELNSLSDTSKSIETSIFTIAEKNIKFCTGCVSCCRDEKKYCFIDDDIHEAYKLMEEADSIVYISPIYESFISGILKNFFDRTNHYTSFFKLAGKPLNLILCGVQPIKGPTKEFSNGHVIENINQYFKNYSIITHTVYVFLGFFHHEDHHSVRNNSNVEEFDAQIKSIAKKLSKQKIDKRIIENSKDSYSV